MKSVFRSAGALLICAFAPAVPAGDDTAYLAELQSQARQQRLSEQTEWTRLLHVQPSRWGGRGESTLDYPGFFLAADGKTDAAAELDATLAAFFDDRLLDGEPRQCRYKGRYEWLKAQLAFEPARLPVARCDKFEEWFSGLNTAGLTLVFASNDLGSPSSMFGHTLLRLDARGEQGDQRLLAYAVNYAAATSRDAGMLYALKGLGGFYQGHFSVMPYYEKVKEYERFEHRDLWEYPLHMDGAMRTRVLWHLWELRGVGSDYFFFTENCSFQLLSLLEAADPALNLTARFRRGAPYTIPIDSVRALQRSGLLGEPAFRPASAHRLQHHYRELPSASQDWALDYVAGVAGLDDGRYTGAGESAQAGMLEVAHDKLYFEYQQRELERGTGLPRARALLAERSRNPAESPFTPVPRPSFSPEQGHGSGRASLGLRVADADHVLGLLGLRPAYHDRLDPPQGYLAGGEIEFLAAEAAFDDEHLRLEQLRLLKVEAVGTRDALFKPWSWFTSAGLDRARPLAPDSGSAGGFIDGGGGMSWTPLERLQTYAFGMLSLQGNSDLDQGYDFAGGLRLGVASQRWSPLTAELQAEWLGGIAGAALERQRLRAELQWNHGVADGLRLGWRLDRRDGETDQAPEIRWMHFF
ncbi:Lnb N-terminal periplasmic domain-containing protein [Solimonas sp. K1W22B-7]|uniref:Lnb N-terminal periplasmic domain-containing protein n=1 Tax=Solimonas sp. K1W22B-7 TaxID=2303331 RepID=UPI0013C52058|nr:DUF4105 domain-containing protein [Solimonas sp. K1W22B-7]